MAVHLKEDKEYAKRNKAADDPAFVAPGLADNRLAMAKARLRHDSLL